MTARTITFAVQLGSGGFEIARAVADGLKYSYYDWEVTSQAANEAGVTPETIAAAERFTSGFQSFFDRLLVAGAADDGLVAGPSALGMASAILSLRSEDNRMFVEKVVRELGSQGNAVVVGHAGQVVLQHEQGVFKVLVRGSSLPRAQRLVRDSSAKITDALTAIQESDQERVKFFKQVYHVNLLESSLYDLTISTDGLSIEAAAQVVLKAAESFPGFAPEAARAGADEVWPDEC